MDEVSHSQCSCDELSTQLSELICSYLELLQLWNVTKMTQLDSSSCCDFVHVESEVSDIVEFVTFDKHFEAIISDPVVSQVKDFHVGKAIVQRDELGALPVDVVGGKINFADVTKVFLSK